MLEAVLAADLAVSGVLLGNPDRIHPGPRAEQHPDHQPPDYHNAAGHR